VTLLRALRDLKSRFDAHPWVGNRPLEISWRLTADLDRDLAVRAEPATPDSLASSLDRVDAVITTPSTLQLEAALKGRPVAVLDYLNRPPFVPAAWTITGKEHIDETLVELARPRAPRMLFQQTVLHDALECRTPAAPRLHELIDRMADLGERAGAAGRSLRLPRCILNGSGGLPDGMTDEVDTSALYPGNAAFRCEDVARLQAELSHAIHRLGRLPEELRRAKERIRDLHCTIGELQRRLRARHEERRE
jgi:hypothetical protein